MVGTPVALDRNAHAVGEASARPYIQRAMDNEKLLYENHIRPLMTGMSECETLEELAGFYRGASHALRPVSAMPMSQKTLIDNIMHNYVDGIYEHLGIDNPYKQGRTA